MKYFFDVLERFTGAYKATDNNHSTAALKIGVNPHWYEEGY